MANIELPYGKEYINVEIPDGRLNAVLVSDMHHYKPEADQVELVKRAIENPIGTPRLKEMAKGKNKVVIIASDHTTTMQSLSTTKKLELVLSKETRSTRICFMQQERQDWTLS